MQRLKRLLKRFSLNGDYLSRIVTWAVDIVPFFAEPVVVFTYTALIFGLAVPQRRAVQANLRVFFPEASALGNFFRAFRVFWNFAWTFTDAIRCRNDQTMLDWELHGTLYFREFTENEAGAVILTAHTGNYDLAAFLFAGRMKRRINIVRVPERSAELQAYSDDQRRQMISDRFNLAYNTPDSMLALELLQALSRKEGVAIQGDRVTPGIATVPATMLGRTVSLPKGPFALALAAQCRIYPMFIVRVGRRRYRTIVFPPIEGDRASINTTQPIQNLVGQWSAVLEAALREYWYCWHTFEPIFDGRIA